MKAGDVLAEVETDKATMEIEAVDEGTFAKIIVPEGTEHVAVNLPIAVIAGEDESVADAVKAEDAKPKAAEATAPQEAKAPQPAAATAAPAQPKAAAAPAEQDWTGPTVNYGARSLARRDRRRDAARR